MTKQLASVLDLVTGASTVVGVVLAARSASRSPTPARSPGPVVALLVHPLAQWALVWGLLLANQIAFDAYVLAAHHGDPAFLARPLGVSGWFQLALDWPVVRSLAAHAGDGRWLAPSALRVQAFLELPFTLYAYLAVARLLGRDVLASLTRPAALFAASLSFSATFSLVELSLPNPYTSDDLLLRALAAVTVPFWVMATSRRDLATKAPGEDGRPRGALGHLALLIGAGSIAAALLVAYDAFLLYNLGHLAGQGPVLVVAWPWAIVASWLAPRLGGSSEEGGAAALLRAVVGAFAVAFFVPSLSIRYAATHPVAPLAAMAIGVAGVALGVLRPARERGHTLALLPPVAIGLVSGLAAAVLVVRASGVARQGELLLAVVAVAFLGTFVLASRLVERVLAGRGA